MHFQDDLRAALSICAAIIGAGFASGREIVSFFSRFGAASWLGIAAAGTAMGALIYVILTLTAHTGAHSLPDLYGALMGDSCRDAVHVLFALLSLTTASAMLAAGGELGALALDLPHAYILGLLFTLMLGLICARAGLALLGALGALLVPSLIAYLIWVGFTNKIPTPVFSFSSALQSLPMGLLYATFNTSLTGGAVCLCAQRSTPRRTACLTSLILTALLALGNGVMLQASPAIREAALPAVLLAAQRGIPGYYISIALLWLAVLTTLSALLSSLRAQLESLGLRSVPSLLLAGFAASLLATCGFPSLVNILYPLLGWVCGLVLLALLLFLPARTDESPSSARQAHANHPLPSQNEHRK